jgi:tetratricopeptide (TPR) repeat protein
MTCRLSALTIAALALTLFSCGSGDFQENFDAAMTTMRGRELFDALLELDQKYPRELALKVNLGGMLLAGGDPARAEVYLEAGIPLARPSRDTRLVYLLQTNLAELRLRQGNYEEAVEAAEAALGLTAEDDIGVGLTLAKAQLALDRPSEAVERFEGYWRDKPDLMSREDALAYFEALVKDDRSSAALEVLRVWPERYGYEVGLGLRESALWEKQGNLGESVLAAAKELEYARGLGDITVSQAVARLEALEDRLRDSPYGTTGEALRMAEALKLFLLQRWRAALSIFRAKSHATDSAFYRYLVTVCQLEGTMAPNSGVLRTYASLETVFRDLPSFYYHLWRAMRSNPGYGLGTARPVLERCILLAPAGPYAVPSRMEIGRLLGIGPDQGARLLLGPEIEAIAGELGAGADPAVLDPVLALVSMPDNAYSLEGMLMLQQAHRLPAARAYMATKRQSAKGRLRERLDAVLGPPGVADRTDSR